MALQIETSYCGVAELRLQASPRAKAQRRDSWSRHADVLWSHLPGGRPPVVAWVPPGYDKYVGEMFLSAQPYWRQVEFHHSDVRDMPERVAAVRLKQIVELLPETGGGSELAAYVGQITCDAASNMTRLAKVYTPPENMPGYEHIVAEAMAYAMSANELYEQLVEAFVPDVHQLRRT